MKLYSFCPKGHGELSFYVVAPNCEKATELIKDYIKSNELDEYDYYGFGTDYYSVTETDCENVVVARND